MLAIIDPHGAYARGNLGLAYINKGDVERGVGYVKEASSPKNPTSQSDLAFALSRAGRTEELRELLQELSKEVDGNPELSVALASAYANSGDADHAIEWLGREYERRIPSLVTSNGDFVFDSIRKDPRFQALMKKIGWTNA
jgi:Flp pilus assembly protein TadD